MPAGSVKTPNSARAKDAKITKSADRSATSSAGKKLVQTRLPFKLITPVAKAAAAEDGSITGTPSVIDLDSDEQEQAAEREPRKRKLSYGSDEVTTTSDVTEQLRRSNSKENLKVNSHTPNKKNKSLNQNDIIELDDDVDAEGDDSEKSSAGKEKTLETSNQPPHVQIKLPLNNKRVKRRKSLRKLEASEPTRPPSKRNTKTKLVHEPERSDSSDDIEEVAEQLNPQKRVKVSTKNTAETKKDVKVKKSLKPDNKNEKKMEDDVAAEESSECMEMDVDNDKQPDSPEKADESDIPAEPADVDSISISLNPNAITAVNNKLEQLTPKQQKLIEQRRMAREEKERKLQEERRLKQQEKEQREQLKKTEREQKEEQRRKEREDKEEVKRKEREEKERKRQAEVDTKNEEKRKRNEAKEEVQRKKDEERRRKELEKEEAELKKKRAAASFTKFFVPKQPRRSASSCLDHEQNSSDGGLSHGSNSQTLAFRPFQIKDDMTLAPVIRASIPMNTRQQLDRLFHVSGSDDDDEDMEEEIGRNKRPTRALLYLSELSLGKRKPLRTKRNARLKRSVNEKEEDDDDVQVIDDLANVGTPILEERAKQLPWMRAKYLHFEDNRRPPYYGTWRKRSQHISARRPLKQDKLHFDYEVDSDCEWEEEEPGESLSASEDEKERESEEESEEEYNEWFVPHGHLSDEELQNDDEVEDGNTREAQKAKLQVLQQEFAKEMKKQTKKIKPRLLGPFWLDENGNKSELFPAVFTQTIDMYSCWQLEPLTLEPPPEPAREEALPEPTTMQLDEPLVQQLVRLVHGNSNSKAFLISEYLEYLKTQIKPNSQTLLPPKTMLREKLDELASWKPIELTSSTTDTKKSKKPKKRLCWVVSDAMLQKYQQNELTLQNQWNYILTPKTNKLETSLREETPAVEAPKTDELPNTGAAGPTTPTKTPTSNKKKRGTLLMSVPRDQQFHVPTKNALISQYLRKQNDVTNASEKQSPPLNATPTSAIEVLLLSD